jgi:2-dehydropantoate 2-reductase
MSVMNNDSIRTCMIIGAGAVGASVGQILESAYNRNFIVGADPIRTQRYRSEGFLINGQPWHPVVTDKPEPVDLLLIAVKYHQLQDIFPLADQAVGEHTQVLSLLNGLASEELLVRRYGQQRVLYGFTYGQDAVRTGNEIVYTSPGRVVFGEPINAAHQPTARVSRVASFFEHSGVLYDIPEDMMHQLWWKLMVNVGMNQVSALYRASYGEFQKPGEIFERMKALMHEVIAVSQPESSRLSSKDFDAWLAVLETMNPAGKTSMLQDVEAQRKTEVELFSGFVVQKAEAHGISVPENERMLRELLSLENSYLR